MTSAVPSPAVAEVAGVVNQEVSWDEAAVGLSEASGQLPWPGQMQAQYQCGYQMQAQAQPFNYTDTSSASMQQANNWNTMDTMMMPAGPDDTEIPVLSTDGVEAPPEWKDVFTVMMRNLPNRYTQLMLLQDIAASGFRGTFDFMYLPIDPETWANKGYAFINFVDAAHAWLFKQTWDNKPMKIHKSRKTVLVSPADLQGLEANYAYYSTVRCSRGDPTCRPLFFREPTPEFVRRPYGKASKQERMIPNNKSPVDIAVQLKAVRAGGPSPTVAKFCPRCGSPSQPTYRFCQNCGASLNDDSDDEQEQK